MHAESNHGAEVFSVPFARWQKLLEQMRVHADAQGKTGAIAIDCNLVAEVIYGKWCSKTIVGRHGTTPGHLA